MKYGTVINENILSSDIHKSENTLHVLDTYCYFPPLSLDILAKRNCREE